MSAEQEHHGRRSLRRLKQGALFVLLIGFFVGVVVYSPLFVLRELRVEGTNYLTQADIQKIAGVEMGQQLFRMDTALITKRFHQDLRIEEARVWRELPSSLVIRVQERVPIATVACDYGYVDFDRTGKVIDSYKKLKKMPIPIITGVSARDLYIGDDNKDLQMKGILEFLSKLDFASLNQISEVSVARPDDIVVYTNASVQIRIGNLERMDEKVKLMDSFLRTLGDEPQEIEFVDFTYTVPFVKMKE